jgi:hypothetical protein
MEGHEWYPAEPHHANEWLRNLEAPWWVAGGWAVDLFLEEVTRVHEDLNVGVPIQDVPALRGVLPGWQFFEAKDGRLTELKPDARPRADVHSLWCRPHGSPVWQLEVMLEQVNGDEWVYRRDPKVRRSFTDVLRRSKCGVRYLAPEVQLLYKSKRVRPRDNADLLRAMPRLGESARDWLRGALVTTRSDHAWIAQIDAASRDSRRPVATNDQA